MKARTFLFKAGHFIGWILIKLAFIKLDLIKLDCKNVENRLKA